MHDPVDDWFPVDPEEHDRQVETLHTLLGTDARRVLDLGAGDGRMTRPLIDAGHAVTAVDRDPEAISAIGDACTTRCEDFMDAAAPTWQDAGAFDAIVCLGNTFMTIHEPDDAVALMRRARRVMADGGVFVIDALCGPLWREVAEGYWQNGISEDGQWQLLWHPGDNVLSFRRGEAVNEEDWDISASDTPLRLWSMGELTLLGHASGWGSPEEVEGVLLVFRAATDPD